MGAAKAEQLIEQWKHYESHIRMIKAELASLLDTGNEEVVPKEQHLVGFIPMKPQKPAKSAPIPSKAKQLTRDRVLAALKGKQEPLNANAIWRAMGHKSNSGAGFRLVI